MGRIFIFSSITMLIMAPVLLKIKKKTLAYHKSTLKISLENVPCINIRISHNCNLYHMSHNFFPMEIKSP